MKDKKLKIKNNMILKFNIENNKISKKSIIEFTEITQEIDKILIKLE